MKDIGILEQCKIDNARKNYKCFLQIEQMFVRDKFTWLNTFIDDNDLIGKGYLQSPGSKMRYKIILKYSYFMPYRFERIWIAEPDIAFNKKIHMYADRSLCLYYPWDLNASVITPLATIIPWVSEWLVKYEFWQRYNIWIGDEVKH